MYNAQGVFENFSNIKSTQNNINMEHFVPYDTSTVVNCKVSDWNEWGDCDRGCGNGKETRTRRIIQEPNEKGEWCPGLIETRNCNQRVCPIDCEVSSWSEWDDCDKSCGTGKQRRTREIIKSANETGKECPNLSEARNCNTQSCPVNCEVSSWSDWEGCSVDCGGGEQVRRRSITVKNSNSGNECPELFEKRACNKEECPKWVCMVGNEVVNESMCKMNKNDKVEHVNESNKVNNNFGKISSSSSDEESELNKQLEEKLGELNVNIEFDNLYPWEFKMV